MKRVLCWSLVGLCALPFAAIAAEAPAKPASPAATTRPASPQSAVDTARLELVVKRATVAIEADGRLAGAYQARGESLFRLGRIEESVKDFDKVVELQPDSMPHNWQRGIALYYAGRFADGATQFEKHREVNPEDVENATWHYLCLCRALGPEKGPKAAREKLIPIKADTRIPLMKVHDMFAGKATADDVIAAAKAGNPGNDELVDRLFYAHLYIAIFHEAHGDRAKAAEHMGLAAGKYGVEGYMGDVARVHVWLAAKAQK